MERRALRPNMLLLASLKQRNQFPSIHLPIETKLLQQAARGAMANLVENEGLAKLGIGQRTNLSLPVKRLSPGETENPRVIRAVDEEVVRSVDAEAIEDEAITPTTRRIMPHMLT